jgi:RNA recognition motif-containing protein
MQEQKVAMDTRLFVGNLATGVSDAELEAAFAACGTVVSAVVIRDLENDRSRGFGFVEMATEEMAREAASRLDGVELAGRRLRVNQAQPKKEFQRRSDMGDRW